MKKDNVLIFAHGEIRTLDELKKLQDEFGDLDTSKLPNGTEIVVTTRHSEYKIKLVNAEEGDILIKGGSRFPEYTEAILNGSTWGSSMLALGKIGIDMFMEIGIPSLKKTITTSGVKEIKIVYSSKED